MRKLYPLLIIIVSASTVFSQPPQKMSYQCVVRDKDGALVTNRVVGMRTTILQGSGVQLVVYMETYNFTATNANGLLTVEIGNGKPSISSFSSIYWPSGPFFLKTEIDPTGGTNYTIVGQSQILSVPYALYADQAGTVTETDPVFGASAAKSITWTNFANWNTAYSWGNHTGLYRSASYLPDWSEITGKPTSVAGYGITDAVNKEYVDALLDRIKFLENKAGVFTPVVDKDGNIYKTITIGTQVWMAENLKTTRYNDSTVIPKVTSNAVWANLTSPAYSWYDNDESAYGDVYGALYNYYAVETRKLCPTGWQVPTYNEWSTLINFLGGSDAGLKLKESVGFYWLDDNNNATNESGFTGRPGGARVNEGFFNIGNRGFWWGYEYSTYMQLSSGTSQVMLYNTGSSRTAGLSVRCIKD